MRFLVGRQPAYGPDRSHQEGARIEDGRQRRLSLVSSCDRHGCTLVQERRLAGDVRASADLIQPSCLQLVVGSVAIGVGSTAIYSTPLAG